MEKRRTVLGLIVVLYLIFHSSSFTQTLSDNEYFKRLYVVGRVWGYLKYFHPEVAKGRYNWDDTLMNKVKDPRVKSSNVDFNNLIKDLIKSAGELTQPASPQPSISQELGPNIDNTWIDTLQINDDTKSSLKKVYDWFRPQANNYLRLAPAGNLYLDKDSQYFGTAYYLFVPEMRMLSLFRYWNIVNYFSPYKNLMDQRWDKSLMEAIPDFVNSRDEVDYNIAILKLAAKTNDSHSFVSSSTISRNIKGIFYLPLSLKFIDGKTVVTKVLKDIGIKPGDIIEKINGKPINDIRNELTPFIAASTPASLQRDINARLISGPLNESLVLTVSNDFGIFDKSVSRGLNSTDYYALLNSNDSDIWQYIIYKGKLFGYIDMRRLEVSQISKMFSDLWNTDALVIDIRNYPKGTMWSMIDYLFTRKVTVAKFLAPDPNFPGTFLWTSATIGTGTSKNVYNNTIYILFNEDTQSQAEYSIMAFEQHPKAIKIGSQTAGADGNVSIVYLPGGIMAYFTGLGTFYPDGRQTQRIGIIPDFEVKPTIKGIRERRDEVLEYALNHFVSTVSPVTNPLMDVDFQLYQNYPNPFNSSTKISFKLKNSSKVILKVYDILGREIMRTETMYKSGLHEINFSASGLSSGVYFYSVIAGSYIETKKMMLTK